MAATYSVKKIYLAVIASVMVHASLFAFFLNEGDAMIHMDNGVQAFDQPRISLSLSKMRSVKEVVPKAEEVAPRMPEPKEVAAEIKKVAPKAKKKVVPETKEVKPTPVVAPTEKVKVAAEAEVVDEISDDNKNQEQIPIVENATFKGETSPPVYPKRALMLRQEGVVMLKALIGTNGNIKDIQIVSSSGYAQLDKSAIDAIRKWKFKPSIINGKPSLSWVKVPFEFYIK